MPLQFTRRVRLPAPAREVFAWHAHDGAFERLTPPWERVKIIDRSGPLEEGMVATMAVQVGPLRPKWVAEHVDVEPGRGFVDRQRSGPFSSWEHHHRMEADGDGGAWLEDDIHFEPPLYPLGRVGTAFVEHKLDRMFTYRHEVTAQDLAAHRRLRALTGGAGKTVAISGATGLLGRSLAAFLTTGGHRVRRLVRRAPRSTDEIRFDIAAGSIDREALSQVDVVVHLAGENVGEGRWTDAKRERILASRVRGTELLAEALASLDAPPALVQASAIGYYGHRGDTALDEDSASGEGFLAEVCRAWEGAAQPARDAGVRVAVARIGIVLSPAGGALQKLALPFSLGVGGRVGTGDQWMSWIGLDDAIDALATLALDPDAEGAFNLVAPEPVDNRTFTKTLGRVLRRPTVLPLPAAAARLALGRERADALLFDSTRVLPQRLVARGHPFRHPTLEAALRHVLGHARRT